MDTAQSVVSSALDNLLLTTSGEALSDANLQIGIDTLNDMMSAWAIDLQTGYTTVSVAADPVTIPESAILAVKQNLAMELAPKYSVTPQPSLIIQAAKNKKRARKLFVTIGEASFPDTLPRGTGNRPYFTIYDNYYRDEGPDMGAVGLVSNTTATTIAAAETPVLVAGAWIPGEYRNFDRTTGGRLTYAQQNFSGCARATLAITCASTRAVRAIIYKNGSPLTSSRVQGQAGTAPALIELRFDVSLVKGQYLELYIENLDSADDLTVQSGQFRVSA